MTPLNSESKGHVDGGHHGDGVEGEEEVGDKQKVEPGKISQKCLHFF